MNEFPVTDVNAHMRDRAASEREEQQVAGLHAVVRYGGGAQILIEGGARHFKTSLLITEQHQAAAIETVRCATAVAVRCAEHLVGRIDYLGARYADWRMADRQEAAPGQGEAEHSQDQRA